MPKSRSKISEAASTKPCTVSSQRGSFSRSARSANAFTRTILGGVELSVRAQAVKKQAIKSQTLIRVKQVVGRSIIVRQNRDIVVGEFAIVIRSPDLGDGIGKEIPIHFLRPFDDFVDVDALAVFSGDDDDVLDRIEAQIDIAAGGKDINLRKDLLQCFCD